MIWTILGFSCGIVAIFCISVAETLVGRPVFEQFRPHAAIALGAMGAAAWLIGRVLAFRRARNDGETHRFLLFDLRYWGPMLLVLGVITLFIRPLRKVDAPQEIAAPAPIPAPTVVAKVEPPPAAPHPVSFPSIRMQGVIFRETRPFAILDGNSYTIGDRVIGSSVTVKAIDRSSVMLELEGQMKVLTMN
jgi:hypothetical protein